MTRGMWFVRLSDGREFEFQHGSADAHPFDKYDAFDHGEAYSFDIPELVGEYPADPADPDTFVLVPKDEVADTFFREYDDGSGRAPQPVTVSSLDEMLNDSNTGDET